MTDSDRPVNVTLSGNLNTNRAARCNLHDAPIPCQACRQAERDSREARTDPFAVTMATSALPPAEESNPVVPVDEAIVLVKLLAAKVVTNAPLDRDPEIYRNALHVLLTEIARLRAEHECIHAQLGGSVEELGNWVGNVMARMSKEEHEASLLKGQTCDQCKRSVTEIAEEARERGRAAKLLAKKM